jgi:hypothetical protein
VELDDESGGRAVRRAGRDLAEGLHGQPVLAGEEHDRRNVARHGAHDDPRRALAEEIDRRRAADGDAELGAVTERPGDGTSPRLVVELHGAGATGAAEDRGSRVADAIDVSLDDLRHAWEGGLARALGWETH